MFIRKSKHDKIVAELKAQLEHERHVSNLKDEYIRELQQDIQKVIEKYEK